MVIAKHVILSAVEESPVFAIVPFMRSLVDESVRGPIAGLTVGNIFSEERDLRITLLVSRSPEASVRWVYAADP